MEGCENVTLGTFVTPGYQVPGTRTTDTAAVLHRSLPASRMDSRREDSELEVSQTTTQMQRMFELTPAVSVAAVAVAASAGTPAAAQHLALEAPTERYCGWTKTAPGPERRRG